MKQIVSIFFILLLPLMLSAANPEQLNARYRSYFLTGNMVAWKQTTDSLRRTKPDQATEMILLYAEYGLIGNYLGSKQTELARVELPQFEMRLKNSLKQRPGDANLYAFSAAMVAYKIALQPWKAPFYSSSHSEYLGYALAFGPNAGLPLVEQGNSLFFRPALVGGNKAESVRYYERAFEFYKKNQRTHWMYFNVGAWLGQVYAKQGEKVKAEAIYVQLLKEAPDFKWVKEELLPLLKTGKKAPEYFMEEKPK